MRPQPGTMAVQPPQSANPAVFQSPMIVTPMLNPQRKNYKVKCVHGMSITLIVLGTLCIFVQIVDIFLGSYVSGSGTGIWSGVMTIIAGCLGVLSCQKGTSSHIVAFLVMSIIAALLSVAPFITGLIGWSSGWNCYSYRGSSWDYVSGVCIGVVSDDMKRASTAMNAMLFFMAAANGITLIVSSAYACHGLCSKRSPNTEVVTGQVHYVTTANGQQQMVIHPFGQPVAGGLQMPVVNTNLCPGGLAGNVGRMEHAQAYPEPISTIEYGDKRPLV